MNFFEDMSRLGLLFSEDGSTVTLSLTCVPALFGRRDESAFEVTLAARDLLRVRAVLDRRKSSIQVPTISRFDTDSDGLQSGTRLLVEAGPWQPLHVSATYWWTAPNQSELELRTQTLISLASNDLSHFRRVVAFWSAGLRPLHHAPLYVAAHFGIQEALDLAATGRSEQEIEASLRTLIALRGTYF